jgi:UDP-N-acetylglucosamine 3-dehydrogenase
MSDRIAVAIVGFGAFGRRYAEAFAQIAGVRLTWVVDPCSQARRIAREQFGVANVTDDLGDALADPGVTAVVVATPEADHAVSAIAALRAGKQVLVEKPLATTEEDAAAMLEAEASGSGALYPAMLLRFDLRYARLRERLATVAPVRSVHAWRNFDRGLFRQYSRTHSFVENAIHDIDLILWILQLPVERVHGFHRNTLGLENPDVNWGVLEFEGGALAVLQTNWLYPEQPHSELQWNVGMQVMGEGGVLEVRHDAEGFVSHTVDGGLRLLDQSAWETIAGEPRGAFGAMVRHLVRVWSGEASYRGATAREAVEAMRVANRLVGNAFSREES